MFVRCRPLNSAEKASRNGYSILETPPSGREVIVKEKLLPNHTNTKNCSFDRVSKLNGLLLIEGWAV